MSPKLFEYKKLSYQGKTIFGKAVMGEFERIEKYFQKDEACFMFVNNGDMILRTPEQTIHIRNGEGLFAKCGNYFFEKQTSEKITLVAAYFYPDILKQIFSSDVLTSNYTTDYDAKKVIVGKLLEDFKENISYLLDHPEVVDDSYLLTKLKEFVILLSKSENAPSVIDFVASFFKPYEYDFKATIENNIFSSLSLDEYAKLCGMSLASFKRKFSKYYNESPKKYMDKRKIERAVQLLTNPEYRISDVAYDCGFETTKSFNRVFKSITSVSPSKYRKNSL